MIQYKTGACKAVKCIEGGNLDLDFRGTIVMIKKLVMVLTVFLLIFTQEIMVFAEPNQEKLEAQQNREEYLQAEQKAAEILGKIYELDEEMGAHIEAININNSKIESIKLEIQKRNSDLHKAKEEIKPIKQLYELKVRQLYKKGQTPLIELLLGIEDMSDMIGTLNSIIKLVTIDNDIVSRYIEYKDNIDNLLEELQKQKMQLQKLNEENEFLYAEVAHKRHDQSILLEEAESVLTEIEGTLETQEHNLIGYYLEVINKSTSVSEIKTAMSTLTDIKADLLTDKAHQEIEKAINLGNQRIKLSSNGYAAAAEVTSLLSYAYKFLGTPYVWGGTTPRGFDCSGFTQYVFRNFGYSLGRTTYSQVKAGKSVSRSELIPGDLIFTHAGHVGIYVGNNQFIHAPSTGDVLKVSAVTKFYAARRIMQ